MWIKFDKSRYANSYFLLTTGLIFFIKISIDNLLHVENFVIEKNIDFVLCVVIRLSKDTKM